MHAPRRRRRAGRPAHRAARSRGGDRAADQPLRSYEQQLATGAARLVGQDPKRVAQVVRAWVAHRWARVKSPWPQTRTTKRNEGRTGVERAAILLLTLGEQEAAQVLKHMGAREVQQIGAAMTRLTSVSRRRSARRARRVLQRLVETQTSVGVGVDDFLRKVLVDALGAGQGPRASSNASTSAPPARASRRSSGWTRARSPS